MDQTSAVLHVARFDFINPVEEVMTMDIDPIRVGVGSYNQNLIVVTAFDERLAIGLQLHGGEDVLARERKLRLLEIDTSQVP
jgi:hypothetical protein